MASSTAATDIITTTPLNNGRVLVGGKVLLKIGGKIIGFANSAACDDNYGLQPVQVLGQLQPIDYVPTQASHRIVLETTVLRNTNFYSANIAPTGAGNYGFLGATDTIGNINPLGADYPTPFSPQIDQNYFLRVLHGIPCTIEILAPNPNAPTDRPPIVTYEYCFYDSGDVNFSSNRITVQRATFLALNRLATPMDGQTKAVGGRYGG